MRWPSALKGGFSRGCAAAAVCSLALLVGCSSSPRTRARVKAATPKAAVLSPSCSTEGTGQTTAGGPASHRDGSGCADRDCACRKPRPRHAIRRYSLIRHVVRACLWTRYRSRSTGTGSGLSGAAASRDRCGRCWLWWISYARRTRRRWAWFQMRVRSRPGLRTWG